MAKRVRVAGSGTAAADVNVKFGPKYWVPPPLRVGFVKVPPAGKLRAVKGNSRGRAEVGRT